MSLKTHLQALETALGGKGPVGKRLDFLMQELNREANTLSSKSQELDTTRLAVDMKVLIEQMRERGETPNGYSLVGTLLRYSELGGEYVRFVRQIMRENNLADFDRAKLSGS